jgi:predicted DNA-binding protein (MmcQ/YjbR family)
VAAPSQDRWRTTRSAIRWLYSRWPADVRAGAPLGPPPWSVSLKCDPDLAAGLRARYAAITAGYHLNKRHWNTVTLDGSVPDDELLDLIDHSCELVVARLPRAEQRPGWHRYGSGSS